VIFSVGLAAMRAAKTLKTIAVLAELPTFDVANWAIHDLRLQQALAVCRWQINAATTAFYE
jgi:hypothetical protein